MTEQVEAFWETFVDSVTNEANVETWFVLPLLEALGHDRFNVDSKVPIIFQEGRNQKPGRKPEADFVVYAERPFSRATSLLVVESKHPNERLDGGKEQGESYAQNLRAPLLLLTNGKQLEVWQLQLSTESTLQLSCEVAKLPQRRAELESLLSPEAVKAHCSRLEHKNFNLLARDLSEYELAIFNVAAETVRASIPRRLENRNTKLQIGGIELIDSASRGALVFGSSGYGKTFMAASILHEAIERRWAGSLLSLPVKFFLPDFAQSGETLMQFITERIAAHKPGFTTTQLRDLARGSGLLLIADGFDRIESGARERVTSELRVLLADQPQSRLYITTRAQSAPEGTELPVFDLCGYAAEDLSALAKLRSKASPQVINAFSGAPDYVYRLGEIPLLADLILSEYAATKSYPQDLSALYEKWLDRILAASDHINRSLDRILLEKIAAETASGPLQISRAYELAEQRADPGGILQRLATQDAITIRGKTVELQHEGLADYLRATHFWDTDDGLDHVRLSALTFDPSSQFPLLLVSSAPSADSRSRAWEAVATKDIRLGVRSLRFSGFDNPFDGKPNDADGLRLVKDLQNTSETLIESHLRPIANLVRQEIAGQPMQRLGVQGYIGDDNINFFFFDAANAPKAAVIKKPEERVRAPRMYSHALRRVGLGPEAGRVLGVQRIKEALEHIIGVRQLLGARIWNEERVFGQLRHLKSKHNFPIDPENFAESYPVVEKFSGSHMFVPGARRGQSISINALLADMRYLLDAGVNRVDCWWADINTLDLATVDDQCILGNAIDKYYQRIQIAYAEVVEHSIPALSPYLYNLRMMPLKFEIDIEHRRRDGYQDITLNYKRWPVGDFEEAGAIVNFSPQHSESDLREAADLYVQRTDELLSRFGRMFPDRIVEWGWCQMPDLLGNDIARGGLPGESAIVRGAMGWMKKDLNALFNEMPGLRYR